jgi:hypothetical protein
VRRARTHRGRENRDHPRVGPASGPGGRPRLRRPQYQGSQDLEAAASTAGPIPSTVPCVSGRWRPGHARSVRLTLAPASGPGPTLERAHGPAGVPQQSRSRRTLGCSYRPASIDAMSGSRRPVSASAVCSRICRRRSHGFKRASHASMAERSASLASSAMITASRHIAVVFLAPGSNKMLPEQQTFLHRSLKGELHHLAACWGFD